VSAGEPLANETSRIEAFSDGVFAVAITLLVLDLKVPRTADLAAAHITLETALLNQWPAYLAYVISFATVLIMWANHHRMFRHIRRANHTFLLLNGLLLMLVTVVPFSTSLLAEHILQPGAVTAAAIYSYTFLMIGAAFNAVWIYASQNARLLGHTHDAAAIAAITRQYKYGPIWYAAALLLAFVNAKSSVAACLLLAIFFALPDRK
jgi:uncharacterized membrane protein